MSPKLSGAALKVRGHGSSILVCALSGAFGVVLFRVSTILEIAASANSVGQHSARGAILSILATAFTMLALYVGAIVTTNTFSTVIAGRTRQIALLRLIGSSAASLRWAVAGEGLLVGVVGGAIGALVGLVLAAIGTAVLVANKTLPDFSYGFARPGDLAPVILVAVTTVMASWIGSRRVLSVSPIEAIRAQNELSQEKSLQRGGRKRGAKFLLVGGLVLLALGVAIGTANPVGLLISLPGGMASFTGFVLGAHLIMPTVLRFCGRPFGNSAEARLARANAIRYPERSTRTTIGLVIGVTLVTMFAVAEHSLVAEITDSSRDPRSTQQVLTSLLTFSGYLVGFSSIIAGVGVVNNLSLNILQRTRELGLLRALGFTAAQVRRTILIESAQIVLTATATGLLLGTFYGWAGAQSLIGAVSKTGLLAPAIPWTVIALIVVAATVLAIAASIVPTRRALRMSPISALAVE